MRYIDICSGISAPTMAWKPLGWEALCFAEIEAAPRSVLAHHYPDVPLRGDFTQIEGTEYGPVDLLVGGTPCQSFSVAGLRGGLADERGNLALEFLKLADRARARWVVWENVPGVFSSLSHDAPDYSPPEIDLDAGDGPEDGQEVVVEDSYDADESHAFACFVAGLSELGYGVAYRVFDAQYAGVPQRRRRVFVVGYLGDWRRAAAVLFERHSLQGHPAPRREKGQGAASFASIGSGEYGPGVGSLRAKGADCGGGSETLIAHSLRGEGFDASEDGPGRGTPLVPVCFSAKDHGADAGEIAPTLRAGGHSGSHANAGVMPAVAFADTYNGTVTGDVSATLGTQSGDGVSSGPSIIGASAVRRLTPRECERLQGFPDDFTLVPHRGKPMADGPRYKMLGNSMAVPVVAWIGQRIALVDALSSQRIAA